MPYHFGMIRHFFIGITLIIGAFGCQKAPKEAHQQSISINFSYSPFSLDPRKCTDPVTTTLNFMVYEGLTRLEPDGTISLGLAKDITISNDKKTYLFHLKDVMWSDGSPLTAYHFEAAWKKALSAEFPSKSANLLFPIKNAENAKTGKCSLDEIGVRSIDEKTLEVVLNRPTPYFLELTSFCTYFPVPFNGDEVPHPNQGAAPLSCGPFQISSWKSDNEIIVTKNPYYWNVNHVFLDEIKMSMISDENTALNLFEKGKLDLVGGLISTLPIDALSTLKEKNMIKQRPIAGTTFCAFNVQKYPFNNVNIRKAFALAVDREKITENLFQQFDDVATGPVPLVLKQSVSTFFLDHQKTLAKQYFEKGLQELGISREEFPKITYHYFTSELHKNLALTLQNYWKEALDIDVAVQAQEFKTHLSKLYSREFTFAQMSWVGQYHDPMSFLERFDGKDSFRNYSGWENPYYSELLSASYYASKKGREHLLEEAESLLMDEMPIIPLYHFHVVYVKNPKLRNVSISAIGDMQFHKAYLSTN